MRNRARRLPIGFIGCGQATRLHLPALQRVRNVEVLAASDIHPERLRRVADRYRIARRYVDYRRLLEDPTIDAVAVCVPPHLNPEIAIAVLESGKHLFIEKPLALTVEGCDQILRRAAKSRSKATVGHNLRWHALLRQAREILAAGVLGEVQLARTALSKPAPANRWGYAMSPGRALLGEFAVHHFDLWRFLFRTEVAEVSATCKATAHGDAATVTARLQSGVLIAGTFCDSTQSSNTVEVYGARARLQLSCFQWDSLSVSPIEKVSGDPWERVRHLVAGLPRLPHALWQALPRNGGIFYECYPAQWQHFADCILSNRPIETTLEDGGKAVQIAAAAIESAEYNRPVRLERSLNGNNPEHLASAGATGDCGSRDRVQGLR